jgi:hypothetical protein
MKWSSCYLKMWYLYLLINVETMFYESVFWTLRMNMKEIRLLLVWEKHFFDIEKCCFVSYQSDIWNMYLVRLSFIDVKTMCFCKHFFNIILHVLERCDAYVIFQCWNNVFWKHLLNIKKKLYEKCFILVCEKWFFNIDKDVLRLYQSDIQNMQCAWCARQSFINVTSVCWVLITKQHNKLLHV